MKIEQDKPQLEKNQTNIFNLFCGIAKDNFLCIPLTPQKLLQEQVLGKNVDA